MDERNGMAEKMKKKTICECSCILLEYKFQKNNGISLAHELNSGLNGLANATKIFHVVVHLYD